MVLEILCPYLVGKGEWKGRGKEGRWSCLEMYLGFILIRYGMMTDMETTAFEEKCIIFSSQEEEAQQATQGHMGKQQG